MGQLRFWVYSLCVGVLLTGPVEAAGRLTESFVHPVGGVPQGWSVVKAGEGAIAEIRETPGGTGLLIERPGKTAENAAVFMTAPEGELASAKIADLSATVLLQFRGIKGSSSRGVVVRAQSDRYNRFGGYYIAVTGEGKDLGIGIYWNPTSHVENGQPLAFTPIQQKIQQNVDYRLQVSAEGSRIEAKLLTVDAKGGAGEVIASAAIDNAEHVKAGYFGLRGAYGNSGPIGTLFRSLHLQVKR